MTIQVLPIWVLSMNKKILDDELMSDGVSINIKTHFTSLFHRSSDAQLRQ